MILRNCLRQTVVSKPQKALHVHVRLSSSGISVSRTFSTTPLIILSRNRIASTPVHAQGLRLSSRTYWWSSKPTKGEDIPVTEQKTEVKLDAAGAPAENATSSTPTPVQTSSAAPVETPVAPPEPISLSSSALTSSSPISSDASSSGVDAVTSTATTLADAADPFAATAAQLAALASTDYSHLFSWFWPSGVFLRIFSSMQHIIQDNLHIASPLVVIAVALIVPRIPISLLQFRAQRTMAKMVPYQEEWTELMKKMTKAKQENDVYTQNMVTMRIVEIQKTGNMKPFASILPAFGLLFVGIGSFLGLGRLVIYQREVVEMGGTGPLAYPGGLFGTGFLEDLTVFSPALLVVMTAAAYLSIRRGALDAPKFTKWQARLPALLSPVTLIFGFAAHFSSAQMLIAMVSMSYSIAQSYLLRIPSVRKFFNLESVPLSDPSKVEFTPFISAWRESLKDLKQSQIEKAREQIESQKKREQQEAQVRRSSGTATKSDLLIKNENTPRNPPTFADTLPPPRPIYRPQQGKKQKSGSNRKFSSVAHRQMLRQPVLPNSSPASRHS